MTTARDVERDLFGRITDRIIAQLDAGTVPWRKPWKGGTSGMPRNAITGREYHGINVWTLGFAGYDDPRWLTFNQARTAGGRVRKGERSEVVVLWKPWARTETDKATGAETRKAGVMLRYFNVFNVAQVDGLKLAPLGGEPANHEPIAAAQGLLDAYLPKLRGGVAFGRPHACYIPTHDAIELPALGQFTSPEAFYATAFHECAHSTGHRTRLAREGVANPARFGDHAYSREELVAEFAASFLCGMAGIERADVLENAAAYIASWRKALTDDPRALVVAAGHAEKAARCVMGLSTAAEAPTPEAAGEACAA